MAKVKSREIDVARLCGAMQRARLVLRRYRQERREAVRQYVGLHWSEEGTREQVPVNLISLYISIVSRSLIAKSPRVMLSTFQRQHKPTVSAMQSWCDKEIEDMRLATTLKRVVLDALFSIGICKVALASPAETARMAFDVEAGSAFAERVDLDDFVYDIHARDFSEVGFIGHRYRVPLEVVKQSGGIYGKARKDLAPSTDPLFNQEGDERISVLGRGTYASDVEEYEDFVDLWEIYLPRQKVVLTLADEQIAGPGEGKIKDALAAQKWLGSDQGPYHILSYGTVPGNSMPKGPIMDLIDLHEAVNRQYRKLIRQADRFKEVMGVSSGATEDGRRIQEANDGDLVRIDNPGKVGPMKMGGPDQMLSGLALHLKDLFGYMAGNLDMMGGLSPQSKTLGQDKLLAENASRAVSDMQDQTVNFTSDVLTSLCWYWWHDPFKVMRTTHSLPGLPDMSITRQVGPEQRQSGSWDDLVLEVDPYSMQHSSPQARVQALQQIVMQVIMPMMPILQQQGIAFDVNVFLQKLAEYLDMPDLGEMVTMQEPPDQSTTSGADKPGMPQSTNRNYTRTSMPGRTQQGNDQNLMTTLMGGNPGGASQPQNEMQGAGR